MSLPGPLPIRGRRALTAAAIIAGAALLAPSSFGQESIPSGTATPSPTDTAAPSPTAGPEATAAPTPSATVAPTPAPGPTAEPTGTPAPEPVPSGAPPAAECPVSADLGLPVEDMIDTDGTPAVSTAVNAQLKVLLPPASWAECTTSAFVVVGASRSSGDEQIDSRTVPITEAGYAGGEVVLPVLGGAGYVVTVTLWATVNGELKAITWLEESAYAFSDDVDRCAFDNGGSVFTTAPRGSVVAGAGALTLTLSGAQLAPCVDDARIVVKGLVTETDEAPAPVDLLDADLVDFTGVSETTHVPAGPYQFTSYARITVDGDTVFPRLDIAGTNDVNYLVVTAPVAAATPAPVVPVAAATRAPVAPVEHVRPAATGGHLAETGSDAAPLLGAGLLALLAGAGTVLTARRRAVPSGR